MIKIRENFYIVESVSELPNLSNRREIFCDVETKKVFDHPKYGGLYPWKGDKICGFGVSADDLKEIWYVPVRHTFIGSKNLPIEPVMKWIQDVLRSCESWINHFIIFDALMFDIGDNVQFDCRLIDTCILSKIYYSDRLEHKLKSLCKDWLDYDIRNSVRVEEYLQSIRSKNYADVPIDLLGEYCCDDVQMNRLLYRHLQNKMPEQVRGVQETETKLTPVLFDMEKRGLRIDPIECKKASVKALNTMIKSSSEISLLVGREFTNSNACIQDILIHQYKLPILSTIEEKEDGIAYDTGRPSFDKNAMALYAVHPMVTSDVKLNRLMKLIMKYRTEQQFKSLFLDTFLELHVDGVVHPSYNQCIRTGRMSCSRPNSQQQNKRSKILVKPHKDCGFISNDYSQIEFRWIVHYCKIEKAIRAYNEDPKTDFHQFVADILKIKRKPAKTQNFGMAYGMGKPKVVKRLTSNEDIIEIIGQIVNEMIEKGELDSKLRVIKFKELCKIHAENAYDQYHKEFPELRTTSRRATDTAKMRGFVFNAYGRRRYLPEKASRKAFNTIIQSVAADNMKERMVAISPRYNSESRRWGIEMAANVHDEDLKECPLDVLHDPKLHEFVCRTLESISIPCRVPILTGLGISPNNWAEAAGDETKRDDAGTIVAGKIR